MEWLQPKTPLTTRVRVEDSEGGEEDYFFDCGPKYLETGEILVDPGNRVVSGDPSVVQVVSYQISTEDLTSMEVRLKSLKPAINPKFPIFIEFNGNSNTQGTIEAHVELALAKSG